MQGGISKLQKTIDNTVNCGPIYSYYRQAETDWGRLITVQSFGLCNAPSQFARTMELILAGLTYHTCLIYLDDILVFSRTFEEHCERLGTVLDRLDKHTLKLKPSKCHLFQHKVSFLGHVVSGKGIECDPTKTVAISAWPRPTNVSEVRTFCGLASYCRTFVPHFSHIAKPLHDLTKKNAIFEWSNDCETSFRELKKRLTTLPILVAPRDEGEYVLDTDASDFVLGAVLHHWQDAQLKVIGFASRSFTPAERRYCITRQELLGVVFGLRKFRQHLLGRRVVVRTDHAALTHLMRTPEPIGQQGRWLDFLAEFELDTRHCAEKNHCNSDALSRRPFEQTSAEDCPQCVRGTTAATAPSVRQSDVSNAVINSPEPQSGSSGPASVADVVTESGRDEPGPPLPSRQWADEVVTVPAGATDYVPAWANMDNWIPVTSPDGRSDNHNGALSATAPTFRPAQSSEGDTTVQQEIVYTLPMQRVAQVSQSPKPFLIPATDGRVGSSPLGTPSSASQLEDSLLTATLAHMGRQMALHRLQMAGMHDAVSEMQCKYQWLTSQWAPQPYHFAGLVRRIACENDSVSEDDESGITSDETEQRDLISDGMRQTTTGRRRRRRPYGRRAPATARDVQAVVMPVCRAKIPLPDVSQQPGYTAWEPRSPSHANTLTSSLTSTNFKPIAARLGRCSRCSSRCRQTKFSHDSRERIVDLNG